MVTSGTSGVPADHHRHPLSYVEGTEAVRERMEGLFCADPVPPGTAEGTESCLASKVTCRDVDWQGTAALLAVEADGGPLHHAYRPGDHSAASCRRRRTASPPRRSIWSRCSGWRGPVASRAIWPGSQPSSSRASTASSAAAIASS